MSRSNSEKEEVSFKKLTIKEQAFVDELLRTDVNRPMTRLDAYIRAYNPGSSRKNASTDASRVLARPHVKAALEAGRAKLELDRRRATLGTMRAIEEALWKEAREAETSRDRTAALRVLASIQPKEAVEEESIDMASKVELLARLEAILASRGATPIDVQSESDNAVMIDRPVENERDTDSVEVIDVESRIVN